MLRGTPVPINPLVDDDTIHIATCKNYLASESGIELKRSDPGVFQLIMQHLQEHLQHQQQTQEQNQQHMAQMYATVKSQEQMNKTAIRAMSPPQPRNNATGQFK